MVKSTSYAFHRAAASQCNNSSRDLHLLQGAELEVLKTLNMAQVNIDVMVVEMDGSDPEKDEAVRKFLLANEFELDTSMKGMKAGLRNEWYVNRNSRHAEV